MFKDYSILLGECILLRPLKIGVIGCGWVSNGHIAAWKKVKNVQIVSVCDLYEDAARSMVKKWNIDEYYLDFGELLDKSDVDVVDICTPPSTHRNYMVQALSDGVHAVTEKPMTMTVKDAQDIVKAKNDSGKKACVIHNWLYEPIILKARSMVDEGAIGEIINVEVEALNTKYDPMVSNAGHWCHKLIGGRLSEMIPHPIYLIRHFLGQNMSIESVHTTKVGDYSWMKSDELVSFLKVGDNFGRVYASFNSPRDTVFIRIFGDKAYLQADIIASTLTVHSRRENERYSKGMDSLKQAGQIIGSTINNATRIATRTWDSGVDMIIKMFADSIFKDESPPVTVEEGLETTKILEKMAHLIDETEKKRVNVV
jgi:predicted dehydrogenase